MTDQPPGKADPAEALRLSRERYRRLFENSPIPLWIEDLAPLQAYLGEFRDRGAIDLRAWFDEHPEELQKCLKRVEILDVNEAAVDLLEAESKADVKGQIGQVVTPESFGEFRDSVVSLASGVESYECEVVNRTFKGNLRRLSLKFTVLPRSPGDHIVPAVVSMVDLTEREAARQKLREALEEKSLILRSVSELVAYYDRDMRIVWVNRAAAEMVGRPEEELVGLKCYEMWHDEDAFCDRCPGLQVLEDGTPRVAERTTSDGRTWEIRSYPVFGDDGEIVGTVEVGQEVTESRRAREALRRSEEKFRLLFEQDLDGVVVAVDDEIVTVNRAFCRIVGLSQEELLGRNVLDLLHPEDRSVVEARRDIIQRQGTDVEPRRYRLIRPDDGIRWVEVRAGPTQWEGRDAIQAVVRDVTERMEAEEALRVSEEKYRTLFHASADAILLVVDGAIAEANRATCELTGRSHDEVIGMDVWELVEPEDGALTADRRRLLESGESPEGVATYRVPRPDGQERWVEARSTWIEINGRPAFLAVGRDITQRRQLARRLLEAQKMEAVGQLAGGVAHDFNNLMTGILCHAEILKGSVPADDPARNSVEVIEDAARRAADLTGQLLGFARRGKQRHAPVDLSGLAIDVARLVDKPADVHIRCRSETDRATVMGDPGQIEQVVLNLLVNAVDAMPAGGAIGLTVDEFDCDPPCAETRPDARPGRYVRLSVTDPGVGIAPDLHTRIFEPFFTTKEPGRGTGMGLAMAYGIVRNHGGWAEVESEPGEGSTFRVYLPQPGEEMSADEPSERAGLAETRPVTSTAETPGEPVIEEPGVEIAAADGSGDEATVLVVDDEDVVRQVVRQMLSRRGFRTLAFGDAIAAVGYVEAHPGEVDLAVIDVRMPGMDGRTCLEKMRAADPNVKAIMATGYDAEGAAQELVDRGACRVIAKPFQTGELLEAVRDVLEA